jgi:hypothetical protein
MSPDDDALMYPDSRTVGATVVVTDGAVIVVVVPEAEPLTSTPVALRTA